MAIAELITRYCHGEKNQDLELVLVNHPDTPTEILKQLANSSDPKIAEAANLHVNFAGEIEEGWYELAENIIAQKDFGQDDLLIYELLEFAIVPDYFINKWMPWEQIAKGIENPHTPILWRNRLLNRLFSNFPKARQWIAACEYTPIDILKQLAVCSDVEIRSIVSLQSSFSPEWFKSIQFQLENDSKPLVDFSWFQWFNYPSTDITKNAILKLAAKNGSFEIKKLVLKYGYACPDELFEILATDTEVEIRKGVALSWSANDCVREKLAQDKDEEVRKAVASWQRTPKYIREQLAKDKSNAVRRAVKDNKHFLREQELLSCADILKQVLWFSYRIKSLEIPDNLLEDSEIVKEKLLEQLVEDRTSETSEYRSRLAAAIDTPTYILKKLVSSPEIKIRYRLAKRGKLRWDLSDKLWEELIVDPEKDKIYNKRSRQYNGNYIPINLAEEPEALPFIIKHYAESDNNFSRFITLGSPLLLPYLFTKYVSSKFWLDRYALAQNPATPKNIKDVLAKDSNRIVRAAAKDNKYISQSVSKILIPKNKIDNHNLLATLTIIVKQAARDRLGDDWHQQCQQETILWEVENKQDLSFANFMIYHGILKKITIDKFIQGFQKQASQQPIRKNCVFLIDPPVTEQSIKQCQILVKLLQNNLQCLQSYQINFKKQENIFQIIIGRIKSEEWIGICTAISTPFGQDWESGKFHQNRKYLDPDTLNLLQKLEPIVSNLTPSARFLDKEFGKGLILEIEKSQQSLIEKLLTLAGFIEITEPNIIEFIKVHLTNLIAYKVGYCFSGASYHHETFTIGETPQRDWLILNSQIYSYP